MVLGTLINHPELLGRDTLYELRGIVARYPYFQTARLLMLHNMYLLHDPDFGAELRRSVLYVSDRRALCRLIEGYADRVVADDPEGIAEEPTVDRTMTLIDAFLGTLPEEHPADALLPIETVGDYAAMFLSGGDEPPREAAPTATPVVPDGDSVVRALELIAQNAPSATPATTSVPIPSQPSGTHSPCSAHSEKPAGAPAADGETLDESYFTETLAKIYIKQHKYSRALEIIRSLYLQFPEKNTYFADQIRFLEKLIINNNLK